VHYADRLAEYLGEPLGTLVLTLSATAIEVSLMLMVMTTGSDNPTLLRDTIFATLMVVLNGLLGLALTLGGWRHREQVFNLKGALSFLHLIVPLSLILLVIPNYTTSSSGPTLSPAQEGFLGVLCVLVYVLFLLMQSTRHRAYFDHPEDAGDLEDPDSLRPALPHPERPGTAAVLTASLGLIVAVLPITLLAEHLGSMINFGIESLHAPTALGGLLVTVLVLSPEGLGAVRAALDNRMQRAVNICLGSSLSTIALTVPAVLIAVGLKDRDVLLGLEGANMILLYATLLTTILTFVSGRSSMLQGHVHLMLFAAYLFFILHP
jgi:Ca2+:H+ antiporter